MAISHAGHNHPATPAGRAACRKAMTKGTPAPIVTGHRIDPLDVVSRRIATRISHKNCNHPETSHANRQCRADRDFATRTVASMTCTIDAKHCENCGSTNPEDIDFIEDGYTACCNELISWSRTDCRNHHAR